MEAPIIFHVIVVGVVKGLVENIRVNIVDWDCHGLVVEYIVVDKNFVQTCLGQCGVVHNCKR